MNKAVLALMLMGLADAAAAQDARQIVSEVHKRATVSSQRYEGVLQVVDARKKVSEKRWSYERLGSQGTSKAIIRFTGPAEVKGVALLIHNHPDRASDQWMWTPAINRDRRIALQDRRTRFFGTDFSFEDLDERDVEHYDYTLRGEETLGGEPCWQIQSTPRPGRRSQYTTSMLWIRKSNYTYARIENRAGDTLVRRIDYRDLQNVKGIWTARTVEIADLTRDSRTILKLEALDYNVPLPEEQFTLEALRRG
jgi:Outer membrane lipoprotein-sorting protein